MATVKEEFEFSDNPGVHTITSKHMLCCANTGRVVALFYNEDDLIAATGLSKKVELIDGKAYQFKLNGQLIGFYRKDRKSFFTELHGGNKVCGENEPSTIQLLEVKS